MYSNIVEARKNKLSINKISRMFHKSSYYVRDILVREGLMPKEKIRKKGGGRKRKYSVNDNFFKNINSEKSAYILGFIYADGSLNERYKQVCIGLKYDDVDMLINISKAMKSTFPINTSYARYSENYKITKKCNINITSHKIFNDLINLGCIPRKSDVLKFPKFLDPKLIHHFMRGYFDGDGTVFVPTSENNIRFGIISTKEFCEDYKNNIPYNGKAKVIKDYRSSKNVYYFTIGSNRMVKEIYEFLYKDATIFLKRKKEIFVKHFKKIKI